MTKQLGKELINSWEWLDAYCLTQRGICELACGQHAIVVIQIDKFSELKESLSKDDFAELQSKFETLMQTYALDDTIVAKYNDATYVIVLHYLASRDEIDEICHEVREAVAVASAEWIAPLTVTVGAAECHHDPDQGYKCAAALAMDALKQAQKEPARIVVAPDILPHHPLEKSMHKASAR